MGIKADNGKTFKSGMNKAMTIINDALFNAMLNASVSMLVDAESRREYHNLTGNTLTSYSIGLYKDKSLVRIIDIMDVDSLDKPTRRKLTYGNGVVGVLDYDSGRLVYVKRYKLVKTDQRYGYETSRKFLESYKPKELGFTAVMCTGTEYSEILEKAKGLNVLTETSNLSSRILYRELKRIKV